MKAWVAIPDISMLIAQLISEPSLVNIAWKLHSIFIGIMRDAQNTIFSDTKAKITSRTCTLD
jgi:hypothetical protein